MTECLNEWKGRFNDSEKRTNIMKINKRMQINKRFKPRIKLIVN